MDNPVEPQQFRQRLCSGVCIFCGVDRNLCQGWRKIDRTLVNVVRTVVIFVTAAIVSFRGEWNRSVNSPDEVLQCSPYQEYATGLSWLCYYRALTVTSH